MITNISNNKIYIGQTIQSLSYRKSSHISTFKRGIRYKLYNAFRKYGLNNFKWEIIDTAASSEELNEKEKLYIKKYDSIKKGYNMTLERTPSTNPEIALKISLTQKGKTSKLKGKTYKDIYGTDYLSQKEKRSHLKLYTSNREGIKQTKTHIEKE